MNAARIVLMLVAGSAVMSRVAPAQSPAVQVAVSGGSATDERGIRSDAMTLAPTVVLTPSAFTTLSVGANATRFANAAWQLGASAALATRAPLGAGFALAFGGGGSVSQASFNATFAQADATPALEWQAGPLSLVGGAHAATGYSAIGSQAATPIIPQSTPLVSQTRSAFAPSYGGTLRLGAGAPLGALLSYREEPTRVGGMLVTDRVAGATISVVGVDVALTAGHRSAPDENLDFANGAASIPILPATALTLAAGSYPSNRLTGAAGGRFVSAGLTLRFGGGGPEAPRPSGVRAPQPDFTRFTIRAEAAQKVELAGDWNAWQLVTATRAPNGVWYVDLPLSRGEYRYAFLIDGHEWRVPHGVPAVDDGFGSKAAYVTVRTATAVMANHNQEER